MQDSFVHTSHGRIHWLQAGQEGEPLVLLHSNGCSAQEFAPVIDALAQRHRVFAWDMPGHGDSDPRTRHLSVEDYTDAAVAFMDAVGLERAWVAGASVGGLICVELAARYASRLNGVIIIEAMLQTPDAWAAVWPVVEAVFGATTQSFEEVSPRFRNLTPEFHRRWNIDRSKAGAQTMLDVMWALREYDGLARASAMGAPAAMLWGDKGPVAHTVHEWRLRLGSKAIRMLPGCGHFPMIDDPKAFVDALTESIEHLRAPQRSGK